MSILSVRLPNPLSASRVFLNTQDVRQWVSDAKPCSQVIWSLSFNSAGRHETHLMGVGKLTCCLCFWDIHLARCPVEGTLMVTESLHQGHSLNLVLVTELSIATLSCSLAWYYTAVVHNFCCHWLSFSFRLSFPFPISLHLLLSSLLCLITWNMFYFSVYLSSCNS